MKIRELIAATGAKVLKEVDENLDVKISTDTRTIKEGDFYLPLKGESFDGENFLDNAINAGAEGCFISRDDYPEGAFFNVGTIDDVIEKAKSMERKES